GVGRGDRGHGSALPGDDPRRAVPPEPGPPRRHPARQVGPFPPAGEGAPKRRERGADQNPDQMLERPCAPSTGQQAPVTRLAWLEQRNVTTFATSSGVPKRPSGISLATNAEIPPGSAS